MWAEHIQANLLQLKTLSFSLLHFPLVCFILSISLVCLLPLIRCGLRPTWTPQDSLCSVRQVLEGHGDGLYCTMAMLLSMSPPLIIPFPRVQLAGFVLFYLFFMSVLCAIYVHLASWSYNMWQDNADMWNLMLRVLRLEGLTVLKVLSVALWNLVSLWDLSYHAGASPWPSAPLLWPGIVVLPLKLSQVEIWQSPNFECRLEALVSENVLVP